MKKRIILLILVLSLTLAVLAGCKNKGGEANESTPETVSTLPNDFEGDTIGEYDFGGKEFIILTRKDTKYEHSSEKGLGGDVIERAVYQRNMAVQDRFKVIISVVDKNGGWEQRSEFLGVVRGEAMGGGGGYDLVSTHSVYLGWMAVEGLAMDMATLPEINFAKAWWNQNLYDEININGHVYFMQGDICSTLYEYIQVLFVNETKFESFFKEDGIDKIYEYVDNGTWTWDKLMQYSVDYGTLGNTEVTEYGLAMNIHSWRASFFSQDATLYTRTENGDLTLQSAPTTKFIDVVEKMVDFYANENIRLLVGDWSTGAATLNKDFSGGNVLFYPQTLGEAANLAKSMSDTYGIVPLPKYDELQEKYYTICRDTVSSVMVMTTADDPTMSGVITEALSMYGYNIVTPEYYETALKVRYFDDPKYGEILDMIRDGLTIEPVACYVEGNIDLDEFLPLVAGDGSEVVGTYTRLATYGKNVLDAFYLRLKDQGLY